MNVHRKRKKIFGKEFVFTVQDEELKSPIYRQIRGILKEPSWCYKKRFSICCVCTVILAIVLVSTALGVYFTACYKNQCQNSSKCLPSGSAYECKCQNEGYSGKHCENYDACWNDPCEGCIPLNNKSFEFECTCNLKSLDSSCKSDLLGKVFLFSQNKNYLIGVDNKNRIKSWNKSLLNDYSNINEFNTTIKSIALFENNLLAIGSCDINRIEIWNVTNLSKSLDLTDHTDCVNELISLNLLNKTFLISASTDLTIRLYDSYFKNVQTIERNTGPVLTLKYYPKIQLIASISKNEKIKIWSFSFKQNEKKKAHGDSLNAICVSENGLIASRSLDNTIKIWKKSNKSSLELVSTLEETKYPVALIFLKNNSLVAIDTESIKVWNQKDENTFECVATLNEIKGANCLAISGRSLLISGHSDGRIQIRNQTSFLILQTLKKHSSAVYSIICLNSETLASASNATIMIWKKINEISFELRNTLIGHTSTVTSLAVLPNNMFASASKDNNAGTSIRIWDQITYECIYNLSGHTKGIKGLAVIENEYLISISDDKFYVVWDISNSFTKITTTLYSITELVLDSIASFSNDSFITGDSGGSLKLWEINYLRINFLGDLVQSSNNTTSLLFYQNYLISGNFDGFIKIWKMDSFKLWDSLKAHNLSVTCLTNINDRNLFASGSAENQIKIWDSNFKNIQTLFAHAGAIIALIYLDEINSLISTSNDMKLNIYKTRDIRSFQTFKGHNRTVQDIAILNHETNLIATCSGDKSIKIWNNTNLIATLSDHVDYVYSLEFSSKDNILISSSRDNSIKLWNILTFNLIKTLLGHEDSVISLELLEDKSILISGSCDNSIIIWDLKSFTSIKAFKEHSGCVNALNIFKKKSLFSGSSDKRILVWSIEENFKLYDELVSHEKAITSLISFNNILVSASLDKTIRIWSFSFIKKVMKLDQAHKNHINSICVSENGLIASQSLHDTIKIWKKSNKSSLELVSTLEETDPVALIFLKNNSLVAIETESIKVWNQKDENTFECVVTLNEKKGATCLAISGRSLLISGHSDGSIQIRNQTSFLILQTLKKHSSTVNSIICLNSETLASASNGTIMIWKKINEISFELRNTLIGHTSTVTSLAVLPNNMFASASEDLGQDNLIRIWDQITYECIYILSGHTKGIKGLAVIENEYLISISFDKTIKVWDISNSFSKITSTQTSAPLFSIALIFNDLFITGNAGGSIEIWSTSSLIFENMTKILNKHNDSVSDLAVLENGFLVSTSLDRSIIIWDDSFQIWSLASDSYLKGIVALKVKKNGILISGSQDGTIHFWNTDHFILNNTIYIH